MKKELLQAIAELNALDASHKVKMQGGKEYTQVKDRVAVFRKHLGTDGELITCPIIIDEQVVRFTASVIVAGRTVAVGHAELYRNSSAIAKKAAVEKCETAALGRALANLGLCGAEFASFDEMEKAGVDAPEQPADERTTKQILTDIYKSLDIKSLDKEKSAEVRKAFALINEVAA